MFKYKKSIIHTIKTVVHMDFRENSLFVLDIDDTLISINNGRLQDKNIPIFLSRMLEYNNDIVICTYRSNKLDSYTRDQFKRLGLEEILGPNVEIYYTDNKGKAIDEMYWKALKEDKIYNTIQFADDDDRALNQVLSSKLYTAQPNLFMLYKVDPKYSYADNEVLFFE